MVRRNSSGDAHIGLVLLHLLGMVLLVVPTGLCVVTRAEPLVGVDGRARFLGSADSVWTSILAIEVTNSFPMKYDRSWMVEGFQDLPRDGSSGPTCRKRGLEGLLHDGPGREVLPGGNLLVRLGVDFSVCGVVYPLHLLGDDIGHDIPNPGRGHNCKKAASLCFHVV